MIHTKKETTFPGTSMPDSLWWKLLWPHPAEVLGQLGIQPGTVIADLCCGNGYFTIPLAQLVGSGKVYGIDLDETLLEEARQAAAHDNVSIHWIRGDAMAVQGLLPEKLDCLLMANTFHGVPDKVSLAHNVASALKEHGMFIIINWHAIPREKTILLNEPRGPKTEIRMSPVQLKSIVEQAGFVQKDVVDFPPYHYGSIFQKNSKR